MWDFAHVILLLRIIERFVITGLILVVAVVVLIAFWRTVHRIDFNVTKEKVGVAGTTLIATPILVLLILVGFAWVALNNKISLETSTQSPAPAVPGQSKQPPEGVEVVKFNGLNPVEENVAELLPDYNCAFSQLQNLTPAQERAVRLIKAEALLSHWPTQWNGEKDIFRNWVKDGSTPPNGNITQLFHDVGRNCKR